MICPNVNSPEWKALVDKIGNDNAWREFLKYNRTIPSADQYEMIGDKVYFNLFENTTEELKSIRTKSTEEIAAGINKNLIRSANELKFTNHIMTSVLDLIGDLAVGQPLKMTPEQAFGQVRDNYYNVAETLKMLLADVIKSQQDLDALRASAEYSTILSYYRELAYINDYADLLNAAKVYDDIFLNFDRYKAFVKADLLHKGIKITETAIKPVDQKQADDQEEDDAGDDNGSISKEEAGEQYDRSAAEINWRNTASPRIRAFVQTIPDYKREVDELGVVQYKSLYEMGMPRYADDNDVFQDILSAGAQMQLGSYPTADAKFQAFREAIMSRREARPYLQGFLLKLNDLETSGRWDKINDLLTFATKSFNNETLLLYKTRKQGNVVTRVYDVKTIDANRDTVKDQVSRRWLTQHKESAFFTSRSEGLIPNKAKVERLAAIVTEGQNTKEQGDLKTLFKEYFDVLGITLTAEDVSYIANQIGSKDRKTKNLAGVFGKNGILDNISKSYQQFVDQPFEDQYGISDNKRSLGILAELFYDANPGLFTIASSKSADGKQKYLYQETSYVESRKRDWTRGRSETVITSALGRPSTEFWYDVKNGKKVFELNYFNGIREQGTSREGKVRKQTTPKEQVATMLLKHQQSMTVGTYINFTLSDKTGTIETKMTKEFFVDSEANPMGKGKDFIIGQDGKVEYTERFRNQLYATFAEPEISRILAAVKYGNQVNIENFDLASKLFFFVPELNTSAALQEFRDDLYSGNFSIEQLREKHQELVGIVLASQMEQSAEEQIDQMLESGIIKETKGNYSFPIAASGTRQTDYMSRLGATKLTNRNKAQLMVMDMKVNYLNAQMKMVQFNLFDPALSFKKFKGFSNKPFDQLSSEEKIKLVDSTWDEFSKRAAALIAPGRQGSYTWKLKGGKYYTSKSYRAVTANDVEYKINGIKNTITDGQEFVTLQEHIDHLYSEGKISNKVWESIYNKIQKAGPGGYYTLTKEELQYVFSPTKPVHVGTVSEGGKESGLSRLDYVKSSRFPLIPEMEAGSERDKLRQWMEKNNIQSLNFVSTKKLGRPGAAVTLFNENGSEFIEPTVDQTAAATQELSREGLRTQQEIPDQKDEITVVSQMNRTLFDGLLEAEFSFGGKKMKGAEAKAFKEKIRSEMFDRKSRQLQERLGDYKNNHRGLAKMLEDVMLSDTTGSYTENDLKSLEIDPVTGQFKMPLEQMFKAEKIQGLINSMINKNVKLKLPGTSMVQVSAVGAKYTFSTLSDKMKSGIVWTDTYMKSLGKEKSPKLQYIRMEKDEVKPAQVLVSRYLKDSQGNLIDLSKYITEKKGMKILDTSKFSPEMFQLVASRIPNQSLPSTLPIEVVGFLSDYMQNTIVVPDGITGQMGADFDVDKLYAYLSVIEEVYEQQDKIESLQNEVENLYTVLGNELSEKKEIRSMLAASDKLRIDELLNRRKTLITELKAASDNKKDIRRNLSEVNAELESFFNLIQSSKANKAEIENIKARISEVKSQIRELKTPEAVAGFDTVSYKNSQLDDLTSLSDDQLSQVYRDLHWTVLTNPETYEKITGSIDKPEAGDKVADREEQLKKYEITVDTGVNLPADFMVSIQRYMDNRSSKTGVGVFANLISTQADFQDRVIRLGFKDDTGADIENPIVVKTDDNTELRLVNLGKPGRAVYKKGNKTVVSSTADILNIMFTEAVDNAKNQLLKEFNWEERAMSAAGVLHMLTDEAGNTVPVQFSMDLTSQSSIENYFKLIDTKQDSFGQYDSQAAKTALLEVQEVSIKQLVNIGAFKTEQEAKEYLANVEKKRDNVLSPKLLKDMWAVGKANAQKGEQKEKSLKLIAKDLGYKSTQDLLQKYYEVQFDSLELFYQLETVGRELMSIVGAVYTYTKGIGPNVFATTQKMHQLNKLANSVVFLDLERVAGEVSRDKVTGKLTIEPKGEIGSAIQNSLILAQEIYGQLFPISSGTTIQSIVDELLAITGKSVDTLGRDRYVNLHKDVFRSIIAYIYTSPDLELFLDPKQTRENLINGDSSLGKRIIDLQKDPVHKRNGFLKNIEVEKQKKGDSYTISFRNAFGTEINESLVMSGFYELAVSENPELRQLAKDLATWPYVTGDAGSLGRFIPIDYYFSDADFVRAIAEAGKTFSLAMGQEKNKKNFVQQVVQNNAEEYAAKFTFSTVGETLSSFKKVLGGKLKTSSLKNVKNFNIRLGDFEKYKNLQDSLRVPLTDMERAKLKDAAKLDPAIMDIDFKYPDYIMITDVYDSDIPGEDFRKINYLYKRTSPIYETSRIASYERVNILGYKNIKEFQVGASELKSVIKDNNNVEDELFIEQSEQDQAAAQQTGGNNPADYTDHSGGAELSDTEWDLIGRMFGLKNFRHYREPGATTVDSAKLRSAGVKPVNISVADYQEGVEKATAAMRMMFKDNERKTARAPYIIRNWAQVKYADAIYAIGTIRQPGEKGSDKAGDDRIAALPIVKGGTGYAVQMAINEGKPVYVFDATKEGWYKYDYNVKNFVPTEIPTLTKNFAGIGSRSLSTPEVIEKSLQAIRDVYVKTFGQPAESTSESYETVSEPYGVVVAETNPTLDKTEEFVKVIQPQIVNQAYKENIGKDANDMFMYGFRWTRKGKAKKPLNNKSYANGGLPITDAKSKDNYVYDTVDQNGQPLAPVSDLQPIIKEIENSLGIDMSNYDAVIGNIYLPGQRITTHRDTTESLSARNYPVVVYTIGNDSGITIYENEKNPGAASFASDKAKTIPTKNGTIYTFGMDGKGRFELSHDTPKGIKRDQKFPPITLPDGSVITNYTITLTFRKVADLKPGEPTAPAKIGQPVFNEDQSSGSKVLEGDIFALPGIPVITTNLGGVHGAGLAQLAKAKGLIKQGDGAFKSQDNVVQLPVKKVWSDSMAMNNNMDLLRTSLGQLTSVAAANPSKTYLLPLAGLGHGEGSVQEILPLLINTVKSSPNIKLVLPAENVNLGRQGTVRQDTTRTKMPEIKKMLTEAGLLNQSDQPKSQSSNADSIYSRLGDKTQSENVVIKPWAELKDATEAVVLTSPSTNPRELVPGYTYELTDGRKAKFIDYRFAQKDSFSKASYEIAVFEINGQKVFRAVNAGSNFTVDVWNRPNISIKVSDAKLYGLITNHSDRLISLKPNVSSQVAVISTRIKNSDEHFGNPYSQDPAGKAYGLIKTETVQEAVEKYIDWVINSQEPRAQWIRKQLQSGKLKGQPILYYKELGEPSHATALDYLINKYDWSGQSVVEDEQPGEASQPKPEVAVSVSGVTYKFTEDGTLYYTDAEGNITKKVNDKSLIVKAQVQRGIDSYPERVVKIKIGPKENSYFVSFSNEVYSMQPTSFGDKIVSEDVLNRVGQAFAAQQEIKGTDPEETEDMPEQAPETKPAASAEKKIVVPKGSNPNNMVIFEDKDNKYLMNDGQQEAYTYIKNMVSQLLSTRKVVTSADLDTTVAFDNDLTRKFNGVIPQAMWNNMIGLAGRGGVGKTTVIRAIIDAITSEAGTKYRRVNAVYMAPTHTAVTVLQESLGRDSETTADDLVSTIAASTRRNRIEGNELLLASEKEYEASIRFRPAFGNPDIIIVDESSMVGAETIKDMVTRLRTDLTKGYISRLPVFIFMGDYRQLGPVNESQNPLVNKGLISSTLFMDSNKTKELTQVMRSDDQLMHQIFDAVGGQIVSNMDRTQKNEKPVKLDLKKYDELTSKSTDKILVVDNEDGVVQDYAEYLTLNNNPYGMFWVHYNNVEHAKTKELSRRIRNLYMNRSGNTIEDTDYRSFSKGDYIEYTNPVESISSTVLEYTPTTDQLFDYLNSKASDLNLSKTQGNSFRINNGSIKPRSRFKVLDIINQKSNISEFLSKDLMQAARLQKFEVDSEVIVLYNRQNRVRAVSKPLGLTVKFGKYNPVSKLQEGIQIIDRKTGNVLSTFSLNYGAFKQSKSQLESIDSSVSMPFVPSYIGSSHTAQGNSIKNVIVGEYNIKQALTNPQINQDDVFSSLYTSITRTSGTLVIIKPRGFNMLQNQEEFKGVIGDNKERILFENASVPASSVAETSYSNNGSEGAQEISLYDLASILGQTKQKIKDLFNSELDQKQFEVTDVKGLLNRMYTSANPFYKAVLKMIGQTGGATGLRIVVDSSMKDPASYNPSTGVIKINIDLASQDAINGDDALNKVMDELMHELVHHMTVKLLAADINSLSPDQRKSVLALKNLFNYAKEKLMNDPTHSQQLRDALNELNNSGFMSKADKDLYYGFSSVEEFVSMMMTNQDFQEFMNNLDFQGEKTLLDRFIEVITNIIKSLGIEVKDNSVLREGMNNILNLIQVRDEAELRSVRTRPEGQLEFINENFESILKVLDITKVC